MCAIHELPSYAPKIGDKVKAESVLWPKLGRIINVKEQVVTVLWDTGLVLTVPIDNLILANDAPNGS